MHRCYLDIKVIDSISNTVISPKSVDSIQIVILCLWKWLENGPESNDKTSAEFYKLHIKG